MRSIGVVTSLVRGAAAFVVVAFLLLGAWQVVGQLTGPFVRFRVVQVIQQPVVDLEGEDLDQVPRYNTFALADFDADGSPDLVAVNYHEGAVNVYAGVGDGTFAGTTALEVGEVLFPAAVVAGDFTGLFSVDGGAPDGNVDLLVVDEDGVIALLIGDGAGDFVQPDQEIDFVADVADFVTGAVTADFDGDGTTDVALADLDEIIFACNDSGTIVACPTSSVVLPDGTVIVDLAVGDFDGDGAMDVVTIDPFVGVAYVVYGDGAGNFVVDTLGQPLYPEGQPDEARLAVANFDGTGPDDFVVIDNERFFDINGRSFVGISGRRFSLSGVSVPSESNGIVAGEFSGDGVPDLVMSDRLGLAIISGNQSGDFSSDFGATTASVPGPTGRRMARAEVLKTADVDGDGLLDLVGLVSGGQEIEVALNVVDEPTPTAVPATATPTPTVHVDPPFTPIATETPLLPTPGHTPPATATATSTTTPAVNHRFADSDDGCAVGPGANSTGFGWPLALAGALLLAGRRRGKLRV